MEQAIVRDTRVLRGVLPILAAAIMAISGAQADAREIGAVQLKSVDGSMTVSGTLLAYDVASYIIETDLGILQFSAGSVECIGAPCPTVIK